MIPKRNSTEVKVSEKEDLPYKVTGNFLTKTELSFYHTLKLFIGDKAVICPKVGLKDIFFIGKGIGKDYMKFFGKISQKHVDFLLCEAGTMKPICGIELDDSSHTSKKSYERDIFVEKLYKDAKFELVRFSSKSGYNLSDLEAALSHIINKDEINVVENISREEMHICPKCGMPMKLRKAGKGQNIGKEFYGCPNYPSCKEIINV